jgi:hypothetical protein
MRCYFPGSSALVSGTVRNWLTLAGKKKPWGTLFLLKLFQLIYGGHLMRAEIEISLD